MKTLKEVVALEEKFALHLNERVGEEESFNLIQEFQKKYISKYDYPETIDDLDRRIESMKNYFNVYFFNKGGYK